MVSSLFFGEDIDEAPLDAAAIERLRASDAARFALVRRGRVLVRSDALEIDWRGARDLAARGLDAADTVFLGSADSRACFAAVPREPPLTANDRFDRSRGRDPDGYAGLYEAATAMPPRDALLAARAVHYANWINRTRYCGVCASAMRGADGGRKRVCANGHEEFPRTDAVVIVLVTRGERCLLGRQPRFPPRRYSAVAGFVQPGETLEAAVRREVYEEVGVRLQRVSYRASQPWPFPTSLMLGFIAEAADERVALHDGELEDARWFERADIARWVFDDAQAPIALPPRGVMARHLIEQWLAGG